MTLDLTTLYVVAGLGMLVAGMIHLIPVATGRFGRWATLWGSGHLIVGVCAIVALVNDSIGIGFRWAPNIGNPLAVMGYALITGAVMRFGWPGARLLPLMAIAAAVALPVLVCGDARHFHLRVAYLSLVRAGFDIVIVVVAVRLARRESLRTGWIVATLFAITVPLFLGRGWLAYGDRIGTRLTGVHDDLGAWLAAGQIAFIIFRAFSLLILQAERGQNQLLAQMERDWLTGALNRAGFDRIAATFAGRSSARRIAVMMLDVDRFKALNDSRGHAAGDAALRSLADIAHAEIGKQGHLVRWGGDEFVCLLPDIAIDRARMIGTVIANRFAQTMTAQGADAAPSVSIGIVEGDIGGVEGDIRRGEGDIRKTEGDTAGALTDLLARADQAMYVAKGERRRTPAAYFKAA